MQPIAENHYVPILMSEQDVGSTRTSSYLCSQRMDIGCKGIRVMKFLHATGRLISNNHSVSATRQINAITLFMSSHMQQQTGDVRVHTNHLSATIRMCCRCFKEHFASLKCIPGAMPNILEDMDFMELLVDTLVSVTQSLSFVL
tara:strand:- start:146 stop:577 length:432 start_codon:yes stop_codon:yes gene_type:complete